MVLTPAGTSPLANTRRQKCGAMNCPHYLHMTSDKGSEAAPAPKESLDDLHGMPCKAQTLQLP